MTTNMEVIVIKSRWIGLAIFLSFIAVFFSLTPKSVLNFGGSSAWADNDKLPFPKDATVTTLITTPRRVNRLTGDNHRNLYTIGFGTPPCAVWQINLHKPSLIPVGFIVPVVGNCGFNGVAFNQNGDLFVIDPGDAVLHENPTGARGTIYTFKPSAKNPPIATIFGSGVPGAEYIAFDKKGNLWTSDTVTAQGRVWKITGPGANCASTPAINCEEVFRIQPMANEVNLVNGVGGVGRDIRSLPPGTITVTPASRTAANTESSVNFVAGSLAFDKDGDTLFIADFARGAIWQAT